MTHVGKLQHVEIENILRYLFSIYVNSFGKLNKMRIHHGVKGRIGEQQLGKKRKKTGWRRRKEVRKSMKVGKKKKSRTLRYLCWGVANTLQWDRQTENERWQCSWGLLLPAQLLMGDCFTLHRTLDVEVGGRKRRACYWLVIEGL